MRKIYICTQHINNAQLKDFEEIQENWSLLIKFSLAAGITHEYQWFKRIWKRWTMFVDSTANICIMSSHHSQTNDSKYQPRKCLSALLSVPVVHDMSR